MVEQSNRTGGSGPEEQDPLAYNIGAIGRDAPFLGMVHNAAALANNDGCDVRVTVKMVPPREGSSSSIVDARVEFGDKRSQEQYYQHLYRLWQERQERDRGSLGSPLQAYLGKSGTSEPGDPEIKISPTEIERLVLYIRELQDAAKKIGEPDFSLFIQKLIQKAASSEENSQGSSQPESSSSEPPSFE